MARFTTKDRSTDAGRKLLSPGCAARTVTVPAPISERLPLEIVAGPLRTSKSTGRDELEVALRVNGASKYVLEPSGAKSID